jgi:hypothetical protein
MQRDFQIILRRIPVPNVYNDIKQTYYAEIQEKKISSYGAYAKRGKGVKHGIGKSILPVTY